MQVEAICSRLRLLVQDCLDKHLYATAVFYADKLVALSKSAPSDVYLVAQALFASKQYKRASVLLKCELGLVPGSGAVSGTSKSGPVSMEFRHLAARCLLECKEYDEVLTLLGDEEAEEEALAMSEEDEDVPLGAGVSLQAAMCVLRARALAAQDNQPRASLWYRKALEVDAYCYEAFAALIDQQMLTNDDEVEIVTSLEVHPDDRWMLLLARCKCKKYKDPQVIEQYLDQLETPVGAYEGPSQAVGNNSTQQPSAQQQEQQSYKQATYASPSITPTTQYSQSPSPQPMQQPQQAGMSSFSFGVGVGGGGCSGAVLDQGTATPNTPACMAVPMSVGSDDAMDMGGTTGASHGQNTQGENSIFNRSVQRQPAFDGVTPSDVSLSPSTASPGPSNHGGVLRMAALPFMTPTSTPSTSAEGKGQHGYGSQQQQAQQQSGWQHAYGYEGAGQASDSYYGDEMTPSGTGTRVGGALRLGSMAPDSMDAAAQLPGMAMHESGASQPGEGMTPAGSAGAGGQPPGVSGTYGCGLAASLDVRAARAELLFQRGQHEAAHRITSAVVDAGRDPLPLPLLPVHVACSLALGRKSELFIRGHALVQHAPDSALSWYAVGSYYAAAKQWEAARRYYAKATQIEPGFAPAWMAYGHAFAAQDERDQAMAAYRMALRLFPGLHLPALGLGQEYCAMGSLGLAERALLQAYDLCPNDPAVCHELGALMYKCGQYAAAAMWLDKALRVLPEAAITIAYEPTLLALGHCLRKLKRLPAAAAAYTRALSLRPNAPGTLSAMGYTLHLQGDVVGAIEQYHSALALRPDDPFTSDMLSVALQEVAASDTL